MVIFGGPLFCSPQTIIPQIHQVMGRKKRGEVGTAEKIAPGSQRKLEDTKCLRDSSFRVTT